MTSPKRCGATVRSTGKPCAQPIDAAAKRCRFHGGASPNAKAGAERRRGEMIAARAMETYGLPVEVSPVDGLLAEVHRTAGHIAWLEQRIRTLDETALVWGKTETVEKTATEFPGTDTTHSAVPHALLKLYRDERSHFVSACKTAIAAGIEERRVRLAESQGQLMVDVIRGILGDMNLSVDQQARVPDVVPRWLRLVS